MIKVVYADNLSNFIEKSNDLLSENYKPISGTITSSIHGIICFFDNDLRDFSGTPGIGTIVRGED